MSKIPPLKVIEWEDAFNGEHGWFKVDKLPKKVKPLIVITVGFELRRSKKRVTLAMSWQGNRRHDVQACDLFTIPIKMIRSERTIETKALGGI